LADANRLEQGSIGFFLVILCGCGRVFYRRATGERASLASSRDQMFCRRRER